jgi:hypothetical protein
MSKVPFKWLPIVVKLAIFATFFNSWVLFEELVVDRYGLWRYMLFYRVGLFCAWDVLAIVCIAAALWLASRARNRAGGVRACFIKRCALCR